MNSSQIVLQLGGVIIVLLYTWLICSGLYFIGRLLWILKNKFGSIVWRSNETPFWNWFQYEYRIKPAPPIKETRWGIYAERDGRLYNEVFLIKSHADRQCKEWNVIAKCENAYRVVKLQLTEIQEDATQS